MYCGETAVDVVDLLLRTKLGLSQCCSELRGVANPNE